MVKTSLFLDISYAQVAVFDTGLEQPFNDWTERHICQGFSWRPSSVSFATIEEVGRHTVQIDVASSPFDVSPKATRAIETPFEVPHSGSIEVASISDNVSFSLSSGTYALRFEYFPMTAISDPTIRFLFMKTDNPSFKILRADPGLSARNDDLLLSASPA